LRERLKLSVEQVDVFSLVGSRFQALGAATEKALSVTIMLLLTDLTSAPDYKSIGIEYCQKYVRKYH